MDQTLKDALTQIIGSRAVRVLTQFAVGVGILYVIDKFFKVIEEKLNDDTKLEIAVWLLGVKTEKKVLSWPDTFATVFDRVFGMKHWSWRCFRRSSVISVGTVFFLGVLWAVSRPEQFAHYGELWIYDRTRFVSQSVWYVAYTLLINVFPDYLSLLKTRKLIGLIQRGKNPAGILLLDFAVDFVAGIGAFACFLTAIFAVRLSLSMFPVNASVRQIGFLGAIQEVALFTSEYDASPSFAVWFYPTFFTSIWLWLYAGSGFILKAARRFDKSLGWFNRRFDIERHPLSSIGLVSGALFAIVYWTAVIVRRVI